MWIMANDVCIFTTDSVSFAKFITIKSAYAEIRFTILKIKIFVCNAFVWQY